MSENQNEKPKAEMLPAPPRDRALKSPEPRNRRAASTAEILGKRPADWVRRNVRMT